MDESNAATLTTVNQQIATNAPAIPVGVSANPSSPAGIIKKAIVSAIDAPDAASAEAAAEAGLIGLEESIAASVGGPIAGAVVQDIAPTATALLFQAVMTIANHIGSELPAGFRDFFAKL